jgi:hypothetical protein
MSKENADFVARYLFGFIFICAWLVINKWPWYQDSYLSHYINNHDLIFIMLVTIALSV